MTSSGANTDPSKGKPGTMAAYRKGCRCDLCKAQTRGACRSSEPAPRRL